MDAAVTPTRELAAEEGRLFVASQWQLIWWRFKKHRLALVSLGVLTAFYLVVLFAEFLAPHDPAKSDERFPLLGPQRIHFFDGGRLSPFVYGIEKQRDPKTLALHYRVDRTRKYPVRFLVRGVPYKLLWLVKTDIHLFGVPGQPDEAPLLLLGTDQLGRDMFSRLVYGTRMSLTIGLVGVGVSLFLGILLGGISGYFGGWIDIFIQRVVEFVRSLPTIPLWLGLAAAMPATWSVVKVYFAITLILSIVGWTGLARVVRGRFLSLREEDFVLAAELYGCSTMRIIFRHMVPSFLSQIIASVSLAIPHMILAETSLSFLGLGLRPPAISYGVLLQGAQNIQSVALAPWLMIPGLAVVAVVLAFNFLGDGLRDAADPYQA